MRFISERGITNMKIIPKTDYLITITMIESISQTNVSLKNRATKIYSVIYIIKIFYFASSQVLEDKIIELLNYILKYHSK